MSEETTAVAAAPESQALAESSFLKEMQSEAQGAIHVRQGMIKIPRLTITNGMSEAFTGGLCPLGYFSCKERGLNFGAKVKIIPLLISESASLMDSITSKPICTSRDLIRNKDGYACAQCPHDSYWADWGTKSAPKNPACKNAIDMIVVVTHPETGQYTVLQTSFRKTSHPAGRALVNLIAGDPRGVPFGRSYEIVGRQTTNPKNNKTYWVVDDKTIEKQALSMEELEKVFPIFKQMKAIKQAGNIVEDVEVDHEDDDGPNDGRAPF